MTWGEVPSRRPSGGDHRIPPWIWRTALIGIGVLILIALLVERETINKIGFGAFSVTFSRQLAARQAPVGTRPQPEAAPRRIPPAGTRPSRNAPPWGTSTRWRPRPGARCSAA